MAVILVATLDTKGRELGLVRAIVESAGFEPIVIDAGSAGEPCCEFELSREAVFRAAGTSLEAVRARADRGEAVSAAAIGVTELVKKLQGEGRVEGILALGGSAGTTIGTRAMRALPFGVPKVMVSTLASGQTRPFLAGSDITLVPSVADIAGLNRLTRTVLQNATWALLGMIEGRRGSPAARADDRPVVTLTMFGVTTPCVLEAQRLVEELGFEALVFHATGVGGQAMEGLVRDGLVAGVLDLTTTEIADQVVGGVLSAGPDRLLAAARAGVPTVVSLGALDMVNFGPIDTVPEQFRRHRLFHVHNANVTLMRTTADENVMIGRFIVAALRQSTGPVAVLIPQGGVSALDAPGKPFHDPAANAALFETVRAGLQNQAGLTLVESHAHINDPEFAQLAVRQLHALLAP